MLLQKISLLKEKILHIFSDFGLKSSEQDLFPVFIGEVAYKEKKIAMSYTKKEVICSKKQWVEEFESL